MRIVEFPSIYIGRNEGLSKLRYIDLAKAFGRGVEIAFRYHVTGLRNNPSVAGVAEVATGDAPPAIRREKDSSIKRAA